MLLLGQVFGIPLIVVTSSMLGASPTLAEAKIALWILSGSVYVSTVLSFVFNASEPTWLKGDTQHLM